MVIGVKSAGATQAETQCLIEFQLMSFFGRFFARLTNLKYKIQDGLVALTSIYIFLIAAHKKTILLAVDLLEM